MTFKAIMDAVCKTPIPFGWDYCEFYGPSGGDGKWSRASQRSEGLGVLLPPGFCIQNGEYTNINWVTKKVGCIGMEAIGSTSWHISSDI